MKKEFLQFEEAQALKELGFVEPCFGYYYTLNSKDWKFAEKAEFYRLDDEINIGGKFTLLAPTYSQIFRWFRDKHNLHGCVDLQSCTPSHWYCRVDDIVKNDYIYHSEDDGIQFCTYEEAEIGCLKMMIKILKDRMV